MPRRSIRCVVDLDLHAVTAPGCWLPSKEDCYISVSFFSQYKNTELLGSVFPIPVNEHFRFEKTYFTALEAEEVIELLEDELVVIELLQMSEYSDGAVHLATYTSNVRDFLYPFETYKRVFQARDRDIFLDRTVAFPGISPKLEFSSKIVVKESYSDELDAIEDAIDYHKNTLKRLRKAKLVKRRPRSCSPRRRSPSPTLQQRIEDMNLTNEMDGRPPFVVRKLEDSLIGRIPVGLGPEQIAKSKPHKCVRTNKYKTVDFEDYYSLPGVNNRSPRPKSSLSRRSPPGVLYGFDPDDEVANLTSRGRSLPRKRDTLSPTRRYRSPSPVRNTPSYSPPRSRRDLYNRVPNVRISRDLSPDDIYYGRDGLYRAVERSHRYRYPTHDALDDLALDTSLAKYRSQVHINNGHYWTERAAELSGKSHRDLFNSNINKIYNRLYKQAEYNRS